jgi:hypothetical protein
MITNTLSRCAQIAPAVLSLAACAKEPPPAREESAVPAAQPAAPPEMPAAKAAARDLATLPAGGARPGETVFEVTATPGLVPVVTAARRVAGIIRGSAPGCWQARIGDDGTLSRRYRGDSSPAGAVGELSCEAPLQAVR